MIVGQESASLARLMRRGQVAPMRHVIHSADAESALSSPDIPMVMADPWMIHSDGCLSSTPRYAKPVGSSAWSETREHSWRAGSHSLEKSGADREMVAPNHHEAEAVPAFPVPAICLGCDRRATWGEIRP